MDKDTTEKQEEQKDKETKPDAILKNYSGPRKQKSIVRVKLSDDQKTRLMGLVKDEASRIFNEYEDNGYYTDITYAKNEYEGVKEACNRPFDGASNRRLQLTTMTVDIIASKGVRQTWGISPAVTLLPEDEEEQALSQDELRDRADLLDHRLRNKCNIDTFDMMVYRQACLYGAAVVKVPYDHNCEYFVSDVTYIAGKDNEKFEKSYGDKILAGEDPYASLWLRLNNGEDITVREETETVRVHGPAPYIVDLEKFHARWTIRDLYRHTVIGEELDMTWGDIDQRLAAGFYDKEAVDDLMSRDKDEYKNKDYHLREDIVMFDLKGDGKRRRFIVTYDQETEIVLRCIYYPYKHSKIHFVIYNAIPRPDSWMGYSFASRMEDVVGIANSFVNSAVNEFTLAHNPVVVTDDVEFNGNRLSIENLSVIRLKPGSKWDITKFEYSGMDRVAFLNWLVNFLEILTGVNASLMSGGETPADPTAPAAKTALKFRSSAMRIEDVIHELQKGDALLAEQCEKIWFQWPEDADADSVNYYSGTVRKTLQMNIFNQSVRYVMEGSKLSFDKQQDLMVAMQQPAFLMQFYPEIWQDPEARFTLLDIILNSSEGTIEKKKEAIMKPLQQLVEAKRKARELMQSQDNELRKRNEILQQAAGGGANGPQQTAGGQPQPGSAAPTPPPAGQQMPVMSGAAQ